MATNIYKFEPDYAIPPGDTLLEVIEGFGMSQVDLAERMDRPVKTINEIIKGKAAITPETALQLEKVLGIPAKFWNNLEKNYRAALAKQKEVEELQKSINWLENFPVKELIQRGYIGATKDESQLLSSILTFFGVTGPKAWENIWLKPDAAFRQSQAFVTSPECIATWLRIGELKAHKIETKPFDKQKFKSALDEIRGLTNTEPNIFIPIVTNLCASAGVSFVFEKELPKTRLCGATHWISPEKAIIQLSFRYRTNDHFWFTFFHEAGHILLHGKKETFIEDGNQPTDKEEEANRFASNFLIPVNELENFIKYARPISKKSIKAFANELGIAPGIVVGRLQHIGKLPRRNCNDLKVSYAWEDFKMLEVNAPV